MTSELIVKLERETQIPTDVRNKIDGKIHKLLFFPYFFTCVFSM